MFKFLKVFCCVAEREEPVFAPESFPGGTAPEPARPTMSVVVDTVESVFHTPVESYSCSPFPRERSPSVDTLDTSPSVTPSKAALESMFIRPNSQRKLIRRVSSMTTKKHREFRLFLPRIADSDSWISKDVHESYSNAVELLLSSLRESDPSSAAVSRHDNYLIGKSYFGIKYNDEGKLEMKARTENKPIWMEKWSKVRFGKKAISNYKNDILTYLNDVGHSDPQLEELVDHPRYVNVMSSKQQYNLRSVAVEVSELTIEDVDKSATVDLVSRRQWLTIIVGGDSTAIEAFVRQQQESKSLWNAVRLCHEIYMHHTDDALHHSFLPVVSGYPLWLRLVSNSIGDSTAVHNETMPAVESFLTFLTLPPEEDDIGPAGDVKPYDGSEVDGRKEGGVSLAQKILSAEE